MEKQLKQKFEQAKEITISIDVERGVMERISIPKERRRPFLWIPALLGLALVLIVGSLSESPGVDMPPDDTVHVVMEHPRNFSPYPSPYGSFEVFRIKKGSENL